MTDCGWRRRERCAKCVTVNPTLSQLRREDAAAEAKEKQQDKKTLEAQVKSAKLREEAYLFQFAYGFK
ncbi:MAG: hypothetical protein NVS1B11_31960 [Terriglobales bacterium]